MNEELKVIISAEITKLKQNVNDAKQQISNFKEQVDKASKNVKDNFAKIGEGIKKGIKTAATSIAAAGTALIALGASTQEYRNEQAKLVSAFEAAGSSAAAAKDTYNDLYRVLGDGGQATEAANHLVKLTTNEKELSEWTNICKGIYATFGDSLPIEGLTEAANETAKVGQVTGPLADALNWAGISEDKFNESLAACANEQEREALIRKTLNGLYDDAAAKFETNNKQVLKQNEAQAKLQETMAKLGEAVAPVVTAFTNFANQALAVVTPYIQELSDKYMPALEEVLGKVSEALGTALNFVIQHKEMLAVIGGVIATVVTAIGLYNAVAAVKAAMDAAQVTTLGALVAAYAAQATAAAASAAAMVVAIAPYVAIVAAISAVIAIIVVCIKHWDNIKAAAVKAWEGIKSAWAKAGEWFKGIVDSIKKAFDGIGEWFKNLFAKAWEGIKSAWSGVKDWFRSLWEGIKSIWQVVKDWFKTLFSNAWDGIKSAWSGVKSWFSDLWNGIKSIYSAVSDWFSSIFTNAYNGIRNAFSGITGFFSGIWNNIKNIFSNVGTAIASGIRGAVSGAINAVLSTAANIINGFISSINFAIRIINKIPGVRISRIRELHIPAMAQGGVVDSATLAMIGENGKEAVVPLENNLEWLNKLAGMLNERMGGNTPIVLQVDGKTFAQISCDSINQLTRQRGSIPLVIA